MTSKDFAKMFGFDEGTLNLNLFLEEVKEVGFSLLKAYPKGGFVPAKLKSDEDDSFAMVKVGYYPDTENDLVSLFVSASKVSKYRLKHINDFLGDNLHSNEDDAPTAESVIESEKSWQPIDLFDNKLFFFSQKEKNFFVKLKNKYQIIDPKEILKYIYSEHISTYTSLRGFAFKFFLSVNHMLIWLSKIVGVFAIFFLKLCGYKVQVKENGKAFDLYAWDTSLYKERRTAKRLDSWERVGLGNPIIPNLAYPDNSELVVQSAQEVKLNPVYVILVCLAVGMLFFVNYKCDVQLHSDVYSFCRDVYVRDLSYFGVKYGENIFLTTAVVAFFVYLPNFFPIYL